MKFRFVGSFGSCKNFVSSSTNEPSSHRIAFVLGQQSESGRLLEFVGKIARKRGIVSRSPSPFVYRWRYRIKYVTRTRDLPSSRGSRTSASLRGAGFVHAESSAGRKHQRSLSLLLSFFFFLLHTRVHPSSLCRRHSSFLRVPFKGPMESSTCTVNKGQGASRWPSSTSFLKRV